MWLFVQIGQSDVSINLFSSFVAIFRSGISIGLIKCYFNKNRKKNNHRWRKNKIINSYVICSLDYRLFSNQRLATTILTHKKVILKVPLSNSMIEVSLKVDIFCWINFKNTSYYYCACLECKVNNIPLIWRHEQIHISWFPIAFFHCRNCYITCFYDG